MEEDRGRETEDGDWTVDHGRWTVDDRRCKLEGPQILAGDADWEWIARVMGVDGDWRLAAAFGLFGVLGVDAGGDLDYGLKHFEDANGWDEEDRGDYQDQDGFNWGDH
jgi:hypothetical protein